MVSSLFILDLLAHLFSLPSRMDLSPICIGLLLSHWNVFYRLLHGSMIYADSEMVLLLVADMVGCPFTELEETTCDFSVHVAFFMSCEH